ncbi:C2h2 finger domain-containing protein [Pleurostoma richardsiae]|uniref:C2h2 finger domain-containing protein n=1 Tax=Pleurostoma richardsiae TaxID=41990 RepID=A0AA38RJD4_9PEZI|nr:C2h2 finger domain-containing protein [Pleurostoma richardsiae]
MGKKKRGHPDVEELLARPWCYYCERDFEDLKLLISHQKAKHFKCDRCGRRLNTAGGLSVHMNQVHKESLSSVENALPNRQGLDVEIFGMEGVPEDIVAQHNQRIIQNFYQAQAERHAATGNPPPGQQGPTKKIKMESTDEIKKRLAEHRAKIAAQKAGGVNGSHGNTPGDRGSPGQSASPGAFNSPFQPPQPGFDYQQQYAQPGFPATTSQFPPPGQTFPPAYPSGPSPPPGGFNQYPPTTLPSRPPGLPSTPALPQRPGYPGNYYPGAPNQPGFPGASTVDELVAGAARGGAQGDDIDQLIRMAEAGIKPPRKEDGTVPAAEEHGAALEKRGKKDKDKNMRMVYADTEVSPEEKMARMPRYAFVPEA